MGIYRPESIEFLVIKDNIDQGFPPYTVRHQAFGLRLSHGMRGRELRLRSSRSIFGMRRLCRVCSWSRDVCGRGLRSRSLRGRRRSTKLKPFFIKGSSNRKRQYLKIATTRITLTRWWRSGLEPQPSRQQPDLWSARDFSSADPFPELGSSSNASSGGPCWRG